MNRVTFLMAVLMAVGVQVPQSLSETLSSAPAKVLLSQYLHDAGGKLNCHFTLESDSEQMSYTGPMGSQGVVRRPDDIQFDEVSDIYPTTVPLLIEKLQRELPDVDTFPEPGHPDIVHLVARSLEHQKDYIMNTKVSLTADLVPDKLLDVLDKMLSHKIAPPPVRLNGEAYGDSSTKLHVTAKSETVRQVLSDYIPLKGHGPWLWESVANMEWYAGFSEVQVKLYAPAAVGKSK